MISRKTDFLCIIRISMCQREQECIRTKNIISFSNIFWTFRTEHLISEIITKFIQSYIHIIKKNCLFETQPIIWTINKKQD